MWVYFAATSMSVIISWISVKVYNDGKIAGSNKRFLSSAFAVMSCLPLLIVMAIRKEVGNDYRAYRIWFSSSNREDLEVGFKSLNNFLNFVFGDPQSIFVVCAIIICGFYFYMIYKESISPIYSVLLFVISKDYFIAMNGMRQYVAGAIALTALPYFKKRDWKKSLFIIFIAFLFHKSVIIFALLYILMDIDIPPTWAAGIFAGLVMFSNTLMRAIVPIMSKIGFYSKYLSAASNYNNSQGEFNWHTILIFMCFFILISYEYKKVKSNQNLKLVYSAVLISLMIASVGSVLPLNAHRMTWYMNSILVLYIPEVTNSLSSKKLRGIVNVMIIFAYSTTTLIDIINGNQGVLPYRSIWSY